MKSLLIYNNNVAYSLPQEFESLLMGETYSFQIGKQELMSDSFSVDKKINAILFNEVECIPYDVIFIPYSLSEENYLELIGLRFAYHIRLTPKFNNIQTPIVFYGFEDAVTLNKLSELGLILFTKYVYQTPKITIEDFKKQIEFIKKQQTHLTLTDEYFLNSFLSKIRITPSGNYEHNHSIINEWSIYRWAKALSLEDEVLRKIDNNIGSDLYFKYLKLKNAVIDGEEFEFKSLEKTGSILYIDDQLDKGWDCIFKVICKGQTYHSFGVDFKIWDSQKIFTETIAKIKNHIPDVVILDFRLHDDDFETTNITDVTGYKILKEIKKNINPGIKVIIFSATNKIWNLQALQDAGADGFILKESPELSIDGTFTSKSFKNIKIKIEECLQMSFLKDIYQKLKEIKVVLNKQETALNKKLYDKIRHSLIVFYSLLEQSRLNKKFVNYAYLQAYQILEAIAANKSFFDWRTNCTNNIEVITKIDDHKWEWKLKFVKKKTQENPEEFDILKKEITSIYVSQDVTMFSKIGFIISFYKKGENECLKSWSYLNHIRNSKAGHENKNNEIVEIVDVNKLLHLIHFIIDKHLFACINETIKKTDIDNLLNKFKNK